MTTKIDCWICMVQYFIDKYIFKIGTAYHQYIT